MIEQYVKSDGVEICNAQAFLHLKKDKRYHKEKAFYIRLSNKITLCYDRAEDALSLRIAKNNTNIDPSNKYYAKIYSELKDRSEAAMGQWTII